jgi:hypothetical protein
MTEAGGQGGKTVKADDKHVTALGGKIRVRVDIARQDLLKFVKSIYVTGMDPEKNVWFVNIQINYFFPVIAIHFKGAELFPVGQEKPFQGVDGIAVVQAEVVEIVYVIEIDQGGSVLARAPVYRANYRVDGNDLKEFLELKFVENFEYHSGFSWRKFYAFLISSYVTLSKQKLFVQI